MQHLNYCRQLNKHCKEMLSIPNVANSAEAQRLIDLRTLIATTEKFMLPKGGIIFWDPELRGLDGIQVPSLPFKAIAIEYEMSEPESPSAGTLSATKRIVFAIDQDDSIAVKACFFLKDRGTWNSIPWVLIEKQNFLHEISNGSRRMSFRLLKNEDYGAYENRQDVLSDDLRDEITVLSGFLNALSCSNVHVSNSDVPKARRKIKSALPFDSYHVLTIDTPSDSLHGSSTAGGHRSPREHLRRGHIRRLPDSRRIWVNAAVVGAGRGAGVVTKDYAVR